jgi:hypothetical protein
MMTDDRRQRPNGAPNRQSVFSYNWPHDFYSLVELGKVKTDIEFKGQPPQKIDNRLDEGTVAPVETVEGGS